jgi:O-antigen/teichoic acid export membrane protein
MAIPSALAINLQGTVLITGMFVSATAAATLASVRTVSRIAIQLIGAINRATMPELSAAGATDRRAATKKIVALNLASVGFILVPGAILFSAVGGRVVSIWTNGQIQPDTSFVLLIALSMVAHGLWYYTSNLMLASNAHTAVTRLLVSVSLASILLAVPAAHVFGLTGVGGILVATEVACLAGVLKVALKSGLISSTDFDSALKLRFWRS